MSFRYLQSLFNPRSIAVIGATTRERRVGQVVMRNLLAGGFGGPIMPVNPRREAVAGVLTYPSVAALPITPDLAIVCTPGRTLPTLIAELGQRGTRAVIVMAGGLGRQRDAEGRPLDDVVLETARRHGVRILGGGTLGIMAPPLGLNATFSPVAVRAGRIAFVSQSDAVGTLVLDWAQGKQVGFSHFVSLGDCCDIGFGEVLDFLGSDPGTRAILLYIEQLAARGSFMAAARAAARNKPVVAIKAGRVPRLAHAGVTDPLSPEVDRLLAPDAVFDAVLRRAGILRVEDLDELFGAVETLVRARPMAGDRLVALSNGGGAGVMAEDSLHAGGYAMPALREATVARLRPLLPPGWNGGNPIDLGVAADAARYAAVLKVLSEERDGDAILVMHTPNVLADSAEIAHTVISMVREVGGNLLTCWIGDASVAAEREGFMAAGVASFATPGSAARAFLHMVGHRHVREVLMEVPATAARAAPDVERVRGLLAEVRAAGRRELTGPQAKAALAAYGVPVVPSEFAADPEAAAAVASRLGLPVALTLGLPELHRRWEVSGVALNLETPEAVAAAARGMLARLQQARPELAADGFLVQRMVPRADARQLFVGVTEDAVFGPVIVFGEGGRGVELFRDLAVGLPPLNAPLAHDLIDRTRAAQLLGASPTRPAADRDAVADALVRIAQLVVDFPEIAGLDINPLFAGAAGVLAVDAHLRLGAAPPDPHRLAIKPYPAALSDTVTLRDGRVVTIRPIRPEDEAAHYAFLARMTRQDIVYRFFHYIERMPRSEMARLTQIDYEREMAFIASWMSGDGVPETLGAVRMVADPDRHAAEFSIIVRSDLKGLGLGSLLLRKLLDYARRLGVQRLAGDVMAENSAMLQLARRFGFSTRPGEEAGIVSVSLDLPATD